MMDQNLGRFEIFEVPPPAYDPYPDPSSHLRRQMRITGETLLLRSPGIELSGIERAYGSKWYKKNIINASLPGNVYASRLDCSLHEIDETRCAVAQLYNQCYKFGNEAVPRIFALLTGPNAKSAILELYAFLINLQSNLRILEQCVPGQNSGTRIFSIIAEDPISRTHHCLIGRLLTSLSEVVLCCKCPDIDPSNFHLLLEFGDDLLRIAFFILRFTYDVHPAIGSAILKYGDRLGPNKSKASQVCYDKIHVRAGPYIPYFRVGQRTDAATVNNVLIRLQLYVHTEMKYIAEHMLDLIDNGLIIAANAIATQALVTLDNLVGLWFTKQYRYKKLLAVYTPEKGPETIDELAETVYRYNEPDARFDRLMFLDRTRNLQREICNFITVMINSLYILRTDAMSSNDHPAIGANRKRTVSFLTRIYKKLHALLLEPSDFALDDKGPFDALYAEQDAYMKKLVYQRLAIGSPPSVLPMIKLPIHLETCRLTTKSPDQDRLMCIERWPKQTIMHHEVE